MEEKSDSKLRAFKRNLKYHEFTQSLNVMKQQADQQQMIIEQMKNGLIGGGNLYGMGENGRRARQREDELDEEIRAIREEKMAMKKLRRELAEKEADDEMYKQNMNEMMDMQKQLMNAIIENENEAFRLKNNPVVPQVIMMPGVEGYSKPRKRRKYGDYSSQGSRTGKRVKKKKRKKKKKKKKKHDTDEEDDDKEESKKSLKKAESVKKVLEVEQMPQLLEIKPEIKKEKKKRKKKKKKSNKPEEEPTPEVPEEEPEQPKE